jgi:hypothetical protein
MDFFAMIPDYRTKMRGLGNLFLGEDRVKTFQIEIMEYYIVAIPFQGSAGFLCNGVVEAAGVGMGEYY